MPRLMSLSPANGDGKMCQLAFDLHQLIANAEAGKAALAAWHLIASVCGDF